MYFNQWVDYSMSWTFIQIKWALWWIFNLITKQRSMLICNITSRQYSYTRVEKQRFTLAPEKTMTYIRIWNLQRLSTWNKIYTYLYLHFPLFNLYYTTHRFHWVYSSAVEQLFNEGIIFLLVNVFGIAMILI
jgi:hypothetical protein